MYFQLEEAEKALESEAASHNAESELNSSNAELALADLEKRDGTISHMREVVSSLENELQSSIRREQDLRAVRFIICVVCWSDGEASRSS